MARQCDQCHRKMSPFMPRKRNESGDLLCEGCSNGREGRPLSRSASENSCDCGHQANDHVWGSGNPGPVFGRCMYTGSGGDECSCQKFHHTADLPFEAAVIRAQAHLTPDGAGALIKTAHGNMDGVTVFHCPFCGSGQVVNSGTSIECTFCHSSFTVLVQPQFPMMPQTVDGQPYTPGQQPGNDPTTPAPAAAPGGEDDEGSFGGDQLSEKLPDDSSGDAAGGDDSGNPFAKKDDSDKPPAPKESAVHAAYITEEGVVLSESAYMAHLAIKFTAHRAETLAEVKQLHKAV